MSTIYVTHCSRDKDPALRSSGEDAVPERLYTSEGLQRFIRYCKTNQHSWAIFSDFYGVVFSEEKIKWYSKSPAEVSEAEFAVLLENFIDRLSAFDTIYFHHRQAETHPLFRRVVALGREKGLNILELSEETVNNLSTKTTQGASMELKHFIDTQDFTKQELLDLIELIRRIKSADKQGATPKLLQDASLAMLFEEPSTRTRISFEVGITELGGHALYLKPGEIHLGVRESLADTARVISRYVDVIMARTLKHETILGLAEHATVPVINGLTDYNHPTQVVCDVFTMMEHMPPGKKLEDLEVTFVGDATNVLSSLMLICTRLGMRFTHAAPLKYQAPKQWLDWAQENCRASGGTVRVTDDPIDAVKGADFIYTDLWWWVGQEDEIPERRAAFMPKYQVNADLMKHAPAHCKFMHCLPASRGVEATDEVMDSGQSIIFDQAENRLHTEKGLLVWLVYPRLQKPSGRFKKEQKKEIKRFIKDTFITD